MEGPEGIAEEKRDDRSGRTKSIRRGRRLDRAPIVLCGLSSAALPFAARGLRLG